MKNVLRFTLAALAVICFAGAANAQYPSSPARLRFEPVRFITSAAANLNGGVVDSAVARRVGAAGASSVLDTTQAINMQDVVLPTVNHAGGATDTSQVWMILHVYDASGTDEQSESGADSLSVAMQVSADGNTWLTTAAVPGQSASGATNPIGTRNDQTIANGAFKGALSLNGAALANGQPSWIYKYRFRGINQLANIDCDNAYMFPFVRFVLSLHDAKGYKISAKVGRLSTSPN